MPKTTSETENGVLILTRRRNERVIITGPDGATLGMVWVAETRGADVRLAFQFPREVRIDRAEVDQSQRRVKANGGNTIRGDV